jgi:hypothetical protein
MNFALGFSAYAKRTLAELQTRRLINPRCRQRGEQILLFGAEFTQVYAARAGRGFVPDKYAVPA